MAEMTTVNIQIEKELKDKMDDILDGQGISIDVVVSDYLRQLVGHRPGSVKILMNSDKTPEDTMAAWRKLQEAFAGEAERLGLKTEQDVVDMCKEVRREIWEEKYGKGNNA